MGSWPPLQYFWMGVWYGDRGDPGPYQRGAQHYCLRFLWIFVGSWCFSQLKTPKSLWKWWIDIHLTSWISRVPNFSDIFPENQHGNGKSPFLIRDTSSNGRFSIVMLVVSGVNYFPLKSLNYLSECIAAFFVAAQLEIVWEFFKTCSCILIFLHQKFPTIQSPSFFFSLSPESVDDVGSAMLFAIAICFIYLELGGGNSKIFYFSPRNLGKMSNFDYYFSDGLKPPTSESLGFSSNPPRNWNFGGNKSSGRLLLPVSCSFRCTLKIHGYIRRIST